jgi:hypothetical protein
VADKNKDPIVPLAYQHNGNQVYILSVVDPARFPSLLLGPAPLPPGSAAVPAPPYCSDDFQALVRALRDAEVIVSGNIPGSCFTLRHVIT